ncbi:MAG: Asp-tRNA(Asn)/Glu-tRNA(Gln) amidotransferase subunit GatC [Bacteroidota bacterium]
MEINNELIRKLERLSRLELAAEERQQIKGDLNNILAMVEKLQEVNTSGVEPLVYISEVENVLRGDEVKGEMERDLALQNAPKTDGTYFQVPKVIQK